MEQKPMLRAEGYARALRTSLNLKGAASQPKRRDVLNLDFGGVELCHWNEKDTLRKCKYNSI
jgi:hypothetical protein